MRSTTLFQPTEIPSKPLSCQAAIPLRTPNATGDKADSDADPATGMTHVIVLDAGENDRSVDAGLVTARNLRSSWYLVTSVWFDDNGNGIYERNLGAEVGVRPGVSVTLTGGGANGVIGTVRRHDGNRSSLVQPRRGELCVCTDA